MGFGSDKQEILRYSKYLDGINRSPSANLYSASLNKFSMWLDTNGKNFSTFNLVDIESYFRNVPNDNTANAFLAGLKGYMKYRCASMDIDDPLVMRETQRYNQVNAIKARQIRQKREKVSLSPDELKVLLKSIEENERGKTADILYAGTVVQFYFGARQVELAVHLRSAKIDWKNCSMILKTAKGGRDRFLSWNSKITEYLNTWYSALPLSENSKWITRKLGDYTIGGMKVTGKTGRKTVQTQFRVRRVDDMIIDMILGHESKSSKIGDVYTDFEKFDDMVRDVMVNKHYMIEEKII